MIYFVAQTAPTDSLGGLRITLGTSTPHAKQTSARRNSIAFSFSASNEIAQISVNILQHTYD